MNSLKLFHFILAKVPHFSVWGYKLDWEALLLGATDISQQHAVETREGKPHDPISPHAFMSHSQQHSLSLYTKKNKHNCHIRFPVFSVILLLITARIMSVIMHNILHSDKNIYLTTCLCHTVIIYTRVGQGEVLF